jgi:hypothetical protein
MRTKRMVENDIQVIQMMLEYRVTRGEKAYESKEAYEADINNLLDMYLKLKKELDEFK